MQQFSTIVFEERFRWASPRATHTTLTRTS